MNGTVVVTGGGRGIGAARAGLAAAQGYAVPVGYVRDERAAEALVHDIRESGGKAIAVQGDVSREADVARLLRTVDRELGTLAILVNNAGVVDRKARIDEMDERACAECSAST